MSGTLTIARGITGVSDTSGTVTSITATTPVVVTPSPLTTTGIISLTTVPANLGGTGVANATGSTITLGGALTLSGAFASTFTVTGITGVTFPTTGTLATTTNLASYLPLAGGTMTGALGGVIGTVGAVSIFAAGATTTGVNFPTGGATIQSVISGVSVVDVTAALMTIAGNLVINKGTLTASTPLQVNSTWNNAAVTFKSLVFSVTDPAANAGSASGSLILDLQCGTAGTTSVFSVGKIGDVTALGSLTIAGRYLQKSGGSYIDFTATDGIIGLFNSAGNNFTRLLLGGSTSSFPSLARSATIVQARLADNSAFAPLQGMLRTDTNATTGLTAGVLSALTNADIVIYDASGQAYRVPCII